MSKLIRHFRKHAILWSNMIGVIFGIGLGFGLRILTLERDTVFWIGEMHFYIPDGQYQTQSNELLLNCIRGVQ